MADASPSDLSLYKRLLSYAKPKIWAFGLAFFGFVLYGSTTAGLGELTKQITIAFKNVESQVIAFDITQPITFIPVFIIGLFVVRGIGTFFSVYFMATVARFVVHKLRVDLFDSLLKLPSSYFDRNSSGHLVNRFNFNVEQVANATSGVVANSLRDGMTVLFTLGYMFYLEWELTLVMLAVTPIIAWVITKASRYFRRYSRRIQNSMGEVTKVAGENISGHQIVKVYGGTDREYQRFHQSSEYNFRQTLKLTLTKAVSTPIIQFFLAMELAVVVCLAFIFQVPAENLIAFFASAVGMSKPMRSLTHITEGLQKGLAAAQDIFEQLDEPNEVDQGRQQLTQAKGSIVFDQVTFQYMTGTAPVLKNINLTVPAGKMVALVGRSGSGKSSLVNLIPRFYEPQQGHLKIDGVAITDYTLRSLRSQIAIVSQNPQLFDGSIADNIAYARPEASREDIEQAARQAHVLEFAQSLDRGLDSQIGDDGILLSGGQRQRIAIARAILKNAPILILDEATSALDSESEKLIQDALESVMHDRTTLVIAHRLSTIEGADQIAVMDQGQIMEAGSHQELIQRNGLYAQLHKMQFKEAS